jgi:hypothetical protein
MKGEGGKIDNGGGGEEKELVKSPTTPLIYLLREGSWAETWRKDRKR